MSWLSSRLLRSSAVVFTLSGAALGCASEQVDGTSRTRTGADAEDEQSDEAAASDDDGAPAKPGKTTQPTAPVDRDEPASCASIREDAEAAPSPVDVVWIVD